MWKRLNALPFDTGIWQERFPYLAKIKEDAYKEPRRNIISGNQLFNTPAMKLNELVIKHGTVKDNITEKSLIKIELRDRRLNMSKNAMGIYESMTIGPR